MNKTVILSDYQAPHHDRWFHSYSLEVLQSVKPERVVFNGDIFNNDAVKSKKYHKDILNTETLKSCRTEGRLILEDVRLVLPDAEIILIPGNHEDRWDVLVADWNAEIAELPDLSFPSIFGLEELGVKYATSPKGYGWPYARVFIHKDVEVTHGWLVRKSASASALATLQAISYDHSVVIGHTHRVGMAAHTIHHSDGSVHTVLGIEGGTMCDIGWGLGYTRNENWQNGFVIVTHDGHEGHWSYKHILKGQEF